MKTIIYHNPRCSKSRQALQLLKEEGFEPEVIEYLKTPPGEAELKAIVAMIGGDAMALIRRKEYEELHLPDTKDQNELISRICAHPEILQRPVVVNGNKACLGRPPEKVLGIL